MRKGLLLLLLLLTMPFVCAQISQTPQLQVTLISQEPDPVEPGNVVKLRFRVENLGAESTNEVSAEFLPDFPFTLYEDLGIKNLGRLRAVETGADAAIVEFKVKVDPKAVVGENEIKLRLLVGESHTKDYTRGEFTISITIPQTQLVLDKVMTAPMKIVPGQESKVYIKAHNKGDVLYRNLKLRLDISDLSFVPVNTTTEQQLYQLLPGEEHWFVFPIKAMPDISSSPYKIPINLTYSDDAGNTYKKNDFIGIVVGDLPDIMVQISDRTILKAGTKGDITIEIANKGLTDIKYLLMKIVPSDEIIVVSKTAEYIGELDSDDTESESFEIFVSKKAEELKIPIILTYRDANNKIFTHEEILTMPLYSSGELRRMGMESSNAWLWIFLLAVITGVAGYIYYKRRKR